MFTFLLLRANRDHNDAPPLDVHHDGQGHTAALPLLHGGAQVGN